MSEKPRELDKVDIIQLLAQDRTELRQGIASTHKALNTVLMSIPVVIGTVVITLLKGGSPTLCAVSFVLSQVLFSLALYTSVLVCGGGIQAGYLSFLENEMDRLAGTPIARWENIVGKEFYSKFTTFAAAMLLLGGYFLIALLVLIHISAVAAESVADIGSVVGKYVPRSLSVVETYIGLHSVSDMIRTIGRIEVAVAATMVTLAATEEQRVINYLTESKTGLIARIVRTWPALVPGIAVGGLVLWQFGHDAWPLALTACLGLWTAAGGVGWMKRRKPSA